MKKLYITFIIGLMIAISGGIFYFTTYREMTTALPSGVVMQDVGGEEVSFDALPKKLKLVEFMYTNCPDICPSTTYKMKSLRDELVQNGTFGERIQFMTITIDPDRDSQEVLESYATAFEIHKTDGWYLLRGDAEKTKELASALKFLYRDPGDGKYIHTSNTYLLDENNRLIAVFGMGENGFDNKQVLSKIESAL